MKRIIAVFLVLSLLIVSASAAGIYEVEEDTVMMMSPVSVMSTDSGISTAEFTGDDSNYLRLIYENILNLTTHVSNRFDLELSDMDNTMFLIYQRLANTNTAIGTVNSWLSDISDSVDNSNYWLQQIWNSISDFATEDTLLDVLSEVSSLDTILTAISNKVATETTLSDISNKVATETTLSEIVDKVSTETTLRALRSSFILPAGSYFLYSTGNMRAVDFALQPVDLLNNGFGGLSSNLKDLLRESSSEGLNYLTSSGVVTVDTSLDLARLIRVGFLGVRSLISGSESDNVYSGTITSNENIETSFTATGLGPMLNKYMDSIQHDTGLLTYMFASPADIQAKKDSESLTSEMADSFLKPDSDASIKLSDVGTLKDSSKTVQQLGETGVTPGQAFEQLTGNGSIFSFFTQETANDLDTTVSTYSRGSGNEIVTTYYEDSRAEFFDLIGKGGEE